MPVVHPIDEDDDNFSSSSPMLFSFIRTTLIEGKLSVRVAEPDDYMRHDNNSNANNNDDDNNSNNNNNNKKSNDASSSALIDTSTTTATMSRPGAGGLWSNGFNIDTIGVR